MTKQAIKNVSPGTASVMIKGIGFWLARISEDGAIGPPRVGGSVENKDKEGSNGGYQV